MVGPLEIWKHFLGLSGDEHARCVQAKTLENLK